MPVYKKKGHFDNINAKETIKSNILIKSCFHFLSTLIPCKISSSIPACTQSVVKITKIQEAKCETICSALGMCC